MHEAVYRLLDLNLEKLRASFTRANYKKLALQIETRGTGRKREVLVRWSGYSSDFDSWEPASAVKDIKMEARKDFYLTLDPFTSKDVFPSNTMSRFTTQLPSYVDLSRNYELALGEFVYPNNFTNFRINDGARFRLLKQQRKKVILPDYVPIAQTRDMERVACVDTAVPAIDHLLSFVNKRLDKSMKTVEVVKLNWKDNRVVISIKRELKWWFLAI
uniref:Chromo domain-containing protein n=1 Tax=Strigamia maritima TaxID=126957 RepID=T1IQ64_STRMM